MANQQKKAYALGLRGCPCHEDLDQSLALEQLMENNVPFMCTGRHVAGRYAPFTLLYIYIYAKGSSIYLSIFLIIDIKIFLFLHSIKELTKKQTNKQTDRQTY